MKFSWSFSTTNELKTKKYQNISKSSMQALPFVYRRLVGFPKAHFSESDSITTNWCNVRNIWFCIWFLQFKNDRKQAETYGLCSQSFWFWFLVHCERSDTHSVWGTKGFSIVRKNFISVNSVNLTSQVKYADTLKHYHGIKNLAVEKSVNDGKKFNKGKEWNISKWAFILKLFGQLWKKNSVKKFLILNP